jgi:hypothetical protein
MVAPVWILPRITGPAGLINSTVRDVLKFVRLFLNGGRTEDGSQVLSPDAVATMKKRHIEIPDPYVLGSHWGAGLIVFDWDGREVWGHDGDTLGQHSLMRFFPDEDLAVVLLTNGPGARKVAKDLFSEIFAEVGVRIPQPPRAPSVPPDIDLSKYAGAYERLAIRYELSVDGDELSGTVTVSGPLAAMVPDPVSKLRMKPFDERTFLTYSEGDDEPGTSTFYDFADGVPGYLHSGARANKRVTG